MITILLLIAVVAIALIFEFINGFHDCANAIATVVSTKVLSPRDAVLFGAGLEFIGALTGTHVAKTIGAGIVNFVNIFAPEVVLIGGGVSNAGEALIGPLNDYVRANRYGGHRAPTCPIRRAALGGDAGIIGAAYLDFEV